MAGGGDVGGRRAFAEHLLDRISGNEMDQQEDERHDQPDDRQGVEDALEKGRSSSELRLPASRL